MTRRNEEVARVLESIAELLALEGEPNAFRIRAYEEAARAIGSLAEDIDGVHRAGRLDDIPHVGESIAAKVAEYLDTGHLRYLERLEKLAPEAPVELLQVPGIGPARARLLAEKLGISTVRQLARAAHEHQLRRVPGFGEKSEERIAREAERSVERGQRMLLAEALPAAEEVVRLLRRCPAALAVEPAGSIRRMRETIGDIDVLVSSERPADVVKAFTALPIVKEVISSGSTRCSVLRTDNLQIDLRVVSPEQYGSALQYFTGSKDHNIALRSLAIERGWKLSEYGLFDERGRRIAGDTEEEIYRALGLDCMPPELRENRGELAAARNHALPAVVAVDDLRGDLHVHTNWSDGHDALGRMAQGAIARGYEYVAITDHSRSLRVARGLTVERLQAQRRAIDDLNERYAPFRVLQGAEIDVLADGSLDYPDEVLASLDVVTVSVHSGFGQPRDVMTERILKAIRHPLVHVLNHPTGRLIRRRSAYDVDLETVIRAAAEAGVTLEIDGQAERLDLNDLGARLAIEAGARLVCNSDAHSAYQLDLVRYAVAMARRGWVEPKHVLNTLPLGALMATLRARRG
ncbi:MAG: DNA polymerase/3'-5' exonuclease PolX [Chloroflexota bacterium]